MPAMSTARMGWAVRRVPPGPQTSPDQTPSASWPPRCWPQRRQPVAAGDYKAFVQALVQHDRNRHVRSGQGDCFFFIDPFAAAVVVEPGMVTRSVRASLEVSLAPGITRGMTVVDPSGRIGTPMVTLVEEARLDRLSALYAASVAYSPPHVR